MSATLLVVAGDRSLEATGAIQLNISAYFLFNTAMNESPVPAPDLRIAIVLAPEFSTLPLGGFVDTLRHAADEGDRSRQVYCAWQIVDDADTPVSSSARIRIAPDPGPAPDPSRFDYVMVHGGRLEGLADFSRRARAFVAAAADRRIPLIGMDSGSFILASMGLLDGYSATIHWRHHQDFRRRFPRVSSDTGRLFRIDRDRITCPGGTAAIDLAVELVSRHCGRSRALKGMADLLVDEPRGAHHQVRSYATSHDQDTDPRLQRAVAAMRERLGQPVPVRVLARECGSSERQLSRLFVDQYGLGPARFWRQLRLDHAAWRLRNSRHNLEMIATECGFADAAHLSRRFAERFGCTPRRFRVDVANKAASETPR